MGRWDPVQVVVLVVLVGLHWDLLRLLSGPCPAKRNCRLWLGLPMLLAASALWLLSAAVLGLLVDSGHIPFAGWMDWYKATALLWGATLAGWWLLARLRSVTHRFDPQRRKLLDLGARTFVLAPAAAAGYGVIQRHQIQVREVDLPVPGLPPDLAGLRIVHLSDIHLGTFLQPDELARVVALANEQRAHLAVVTGDLITLRDDHLFECLQLLSQLRAEAGIFGCLGNHEQAARCETKARRAAANLGIEILRGARRLLRFGQARLNLAGVDHQRKGTPYLVGAEKLVDSSAVNVLLSHNPDVFPVAAKKGFQVILSGHTHAGQITAGVFQQYLNPARFYTPYVYGLYTHDRSSLYVTSGVGTVVLPARIGAPAEIAVIRLCAT